MILQYLALGAACILMLVGCTATVMLVTDVKNTRLKPAPRIIAQILMLIILALPALWVTVRAFS